MAETKARILLIDDEPAVRGVLGDSLKNAGYSVFDAGDYYQGLELLEGMPVGHIDLLITDVSLPGPNGCEFALRFLARDPKGKVLFISGYTGAEVCTGYGIRLSDSDFLAKPIYPEALIERVQAILDREDAAIPEWVSRRLQEYGAEAINIRP